VVAVDAGPPRATLVSTVTALRVEYSPDAPAESRARLFLKPRWTGSIPICSR
jgi:hypothetical protein